MFIPKISIITSVFKGDDFIRPFLVDITRQTCFADCELILINANSPHNEEPVIKEYLAKHSNIKYIRLDKDPGVYAVWNIGVKEAKGEYITNANLDDRKHPAHLKKHLEVLENNPKIDLVYADVLETYVPNQIFERCTPASFTRYPEFSYANLLKHNMPHNNPVWRKSIHDRYGYFREDMLSAADFEMWLRAASEGSIFKKVNEMLSLYYRNPNGISTKKETLDRAVEEVLKIKAKYADKMDFRAFMMPQI